MDKLTIDILYAFLTLCRNVSRKEEYVPSDHWEESKIILTGGVQRDLVADVEPKDYDIHICCDKEHIISWKKTINRLKKTSLLFGTESFQILNSPGSLSPFAITASFNILFRGIILDVFLRPRLVGYGSFHGDLIPRVPFFVVNSCYSVLKEKRNSFSHILNYRYHNDEESESYITQASFFKTCYGKKLTLHPFWKKSSLEEDKAQNRLMQIHFLNRFSKMIEKGYKVDEDDREFITSILEIMKKNICFLCHTELEEDGVKNTRLLITNCCHGIVHDECIPVEEKQRFLNPRKCNCCGASREYNTNDLHIPITLNTGIFSKLT